MDSSSNNHSYHLQNGQPSSGLLRFRSAPSLLLAGNNQGDAVLSFHEFEGKPAVVKESGAVSYRGSSNLPPHYPRQSGFSGALELDSSCSNYGLFGSYGSSGLSRQSTSPAAAIATHHHFNAHNGYATLKGVGNYSVGMGSSGEASPRILKNQLSFSSRVPSSFGMLSQISEAGTKSIGLDVGKFGSGIDDTQFFSSSGVPCGYWSDARFADSFNCMKRDQQKDGSLFSSTENGLIGDRMHLLSQHLSLPRSSAEMLGTEKLFHFQDTIPCKIRAKRGCATHPRSIAERVRRTRISERMRKLQELVPNMEKQTNTADMLDLAVEYIKDLQNQYKTLSENRANCKCLCKQKPAQNQIV